MFLFILKVMGVFLVVVFALCAFKVLSDNFNAWYYEKQYRAYLQAREACRKEQEKQIEQNNQNRG